MGVRVDISPSRIRGRTHPHVSYWDYDGRKSSGDTLMVTHIDTEDELRKLKHQPITAEMGICMSSTEVSRLAKLGVPREKLCYVNPGHKAIIEPRKIVVGVDKTVLEWAREGIHVARIGRPSVAQGLPVQDIGDGWNDIVAALRKRTVEVDHCDRFKTKVYAELISSLDYYLYAGQDKSSMGFIDAVSAGIPTIVTPQGFHLDAAAGITYAFSRMEERETILSTSECREPTVCRLFPDGRSPRMPAGHLRICEVVHARRTGQSVSPELGCDLTEMSVVW